MVVVAVLTSTVTIRGGLENYQKWNEGRGEGLSERFGSTNFSSNGAGGKVSALGAPTLPAMSELLMKSVCNVYLLTTSCHISSIHCCCVMHQYFNIIFWSNCIT